MSIRTSARRLCDNGATEVVIMDGAVFVSIYRQEIMVEQRVYNAADLLDMDVDWILLRSLSSRPRKAALTVVE